MTKQTTTYTLNMTVTDDSGFLSPYSETSTPVISSEVADFLENSANAANPKDALCLNVYSDCIDADEQARYPDAIRNHFALKLTSEQRNLHRNNVLSCIFALIGVVGLAVMILCEHLFNLQSIWVEVMDIFAWVFIWEAVDQYFIQRTVLKMNIRRYRAFIEMDVRFFPISTVG